MWRRMALIVGTILCVPDGGLAQNVVIATEGANPPYNFTDESGAIDGFERELGDALCKRMELVCDWVAQPSDALISGLLAGDYDAVMAAIPHDADHGSGVERTQPYLYPNIHSFVGLSGTRVQFGQGTIAVVTDLDISGYRAEGGRKYIDYTSIEEALDALKSGSVDAVLAPKSILAGVVSVSAGELDYVYTDHKFVSGVSVVLREADVDLRFKFEDAIFEMDQDRSLGEIAVRWFGEGVATH